jgi:hypothetical protein
LPESHSAATCFTEGTDTNVELDELPTSCDNISVQSPDELISRLLRKVHACIELGVAATVGCCSNCWVLQQLLELMKETAVVLFRGIEYSEMRKERLLGMNQFM